MIVDWQAVKRCSWKLCSATVSCPPVCRCISMQSWRLIIFAGSTASSRLSRLLMADWITLFSQQIDGQLQEVSRETYRSCGEAVPEASSVPCRESMSELRVSLSSGSHPVVSASQGTLDCEVSLLLEAASWCNPSKPCKNLKVQYRRESLQHWFPAFDSALRHYFVIYSGND